LKLDVLQGERQNHRSGFWKSKGVPGKVAGTRARKDTGAA